MKIILKEDVKSLGRCGEEITVANGYGRNFLIPRMLAVPATEKSLKQLNHQRRIMRDKAKKALKDAQNFGTKLSQINCTLKRKAGEEGKLFGSVTSMDIAKHLEENGITIDKRNIHLEEPLRSLGSFQIPIKLHHDVVVDLKVTVEKE